MNRQRLLVVLASVFAGISVLLVMLGIAYNLFIAVFAIPFGLTAYLMWYQASGRLFRRARWRYVDPSQQHDMGSGGPTGGFGRTGRTRRAGAGVAGGNGPSMTDREAYRRLGLEPGADEATVRRAYRRTVKRVHPDRESGSEEAFRQVKEAYEHLSE